MDQRFTQLDLLIAKPLYSMLVELARNGGDTITYGDLVRLARAEYPGIDAIQRMIPRGVGRRLEAVRAFTRSRGYPDITSLVVQQDSGECGSGFFGNGATTRAEVKAFDWSSVDAQLLLYFEELSRAAVRPRKVPRAKAKEQFFDFAKSRSIRGPVPNKVRETVIQDICNGASPEDAFTKAGLC